MQVILCSHIANVHIYNSFVWYVMLNIVMT